MLQNRETSYSYRWVILGVLWITYIVALIHRLSIGPLGPFFKEDLGITSTEVGLVMSAGSLGFMLTLFPVGWLVDRTGAKLPMIVGELIVGTTMIILFFFPSFTSLLILMFLSGLGGGFLLPSTTQGVISWFSAKERATALGIMQTTINIGGMIGAATLPTIALVLGWRYGFLFYGFLALAVATLIFILYKEPATVAPFSATDSPLPPVKPVSLLESLKSREIWLVGFSGLCLNWVEFAIIAHLVLYLTEKLLYPVVFAGGILALVEASGIVGRPGWGILSDRFFGARRKPVFILLAGIAGAMCLIVGFGGASLSWTIYPAFFLLGLGSIGFGGIFLTLVAELGGREGAGKASGLGVAITTGGSILGPLTFGQIVDKTHSYEWAWLSLAIMAALSILLLAFVREGKRKI